jgi:hypothetical protein
MEIVAWIMYRSWLLLSKCQYLRSYQRRSAKVTCSTGHVSINDRNGPQILLSFFWIVDVIKTSSTSCYNSAGRVGVTILFSAPRTPVRAFADNHQTYWKLVICTRITNKKTKNSDHFHLDHGKTIRLADIKSQWRNHTLLQMWRWKTKLLNSGDIWVLSRRWRLEDSQSAGP